MLSQPPPKKNRFALPKNADDITKAQQSAIPPKTQEATKGALRTWQDWAIERIVGDDGDDLPHDLQCMTNEQLNFWVPRFIHVQLQTTCKSIKQKD